MPIQNLVQRAFAAGELAPSLGARADLALYTVGLKTCRNFVVMRSGGVANRAGTKYLATAKTPGNLIKLYKWVFTAASDSTLIEAGDLYFRFYKNGVPLTVSGVAAYNGATAYVVGDLVSSGGVNYYCIAATTGNAPPNATYWYALTGNLYEIPTPYTANSFNSPGPLRFAQNGADVTITHTAYQPRVLKNLTGNAANPIWTLTPLSTAPGIAAPGSVTATAGTAGTLNPKYVVTAVSGQDTANPLEESLGGTPATCASSDTPTEDAPNTISWGAVTDATEYRIYLDPIGNGTFGYIGTATGQTTFKDTGLAPDFFQTPPQARVLFTTSLNFPEICGYYQQRRMMAYTDNGPATVWGSRIGHPDNFSIRSPLQDDDAVTFTMQSDELNVIRHLIRLKRLVILTDGGAWLVRGDDTGALIPRAINLDQYGYSGASRAQPAVVANTLLYVQKQGTTVRELKYDEQGDSGLLGRDLTVLADHLTEGYSLTKLDYQSNPHSIVWAVRSDGTLLGLTYLPEDQVVGWHRHDTAATGVIEDICVVPEDGEDVLYLVVQRTINGSTTRYIEKLESRIIGFTDSNVAADAFFVDCGITKTGASSTSVTGLDHLEGQTVYALADGLVQGPFTVSGGAITLTTAASTVHVGLRITAQLETLDLDINGSGVRDRQKRVQSMGAIVYASKPGFYAGPDTSNLQPQTRASWQSATGIDSGYFDVDLVSAFTEAGRTVIQHTDPTPLTILALIPRFEVGG